MKANSEIGAILLVIAIAQSIPSIHGSDIDHLIIITRHGERYPLFPVPEMGNFTVRAPLGSLDRLREQSRCD